MPKDPSTLYRLLQKQLAQIGWIARGNVFRRHYTIQVEGKPKRYGPYFCLTRKQDKKTVTHALSPEQYKLYSAAIANHRRVENILKKMRKLTVRFIQQSTQGPTQRNRLS